MALEFPGKEGTKATKNQASFSQRKIQQPSEEGFGTPVAFSAFIAKHNLFRKGLKSQLTFSAPTTNHCRRFREGLETQPTSTTSTSLIIDSDISDVIGSSIKPSEVGYSL